MNRWAFTAAVGALVAAAAPSNAAIFFGLQQAGVNGGAVVNANTVKGAALVDNGKGSVAFIGDYGTFSSTITATGSPALPQPTLQTNGISVSSAVAGVLTLYVTQTDLSAPVNFLLSSFTANSFTGNAISVVTSTLFSASNQLFAGTQIASANFTDIGTATSLNAVTKGAGLYSETTKYVITVGNGNSSVNNTINLSAVPEVATWAMMVIGFGAIGATMRSRRTSIRFA